MFEIFLISSSAFLILVIWFKSEAFQEYCKIFYADKFFLIHDFEEKQKNDLTLDYHSYLLKDHDSFFIRLITCPICFSVWITLILCFFFENFIAFPICNSIALITYYIFNKIAE